MEPSRALGQGWVDSITDDVNEMDVVADDDVRRYVESRGGELYVWLRHHGWRFWGVTLVEAQTENPGHGRYFRRVRAHHLGFDLYMEAGMRLWPRTLELDLAGRFRKVVRAYWNGLAMVA